MKEIKSKISILNLNSFLLLLLFAPFIKPAGITNINWLNKAFLVCKYFSVFYIIIFIFLKNIFVKKKIIINKKMLGIYLYFFIFTINDYVRNFNWFSVLKNIILIYLLDALLNELIEKDKEMLILKILNTLFSVYLYLHFFTIICFNIMNIWPFGENIYFLGGDNYAAFYIIPMLSIILYYNYIAKKKNKTNATILLFMNLILNIYTKSVTAIFASFVMLIFSYSNKKILVKMFSIKKIIVYITIFLFLIVVVKIQEHFAFIIEGFGKDITLTYRTTLWKWAFENIRQYPLFGSGSYFGAVFLIKHYSTVMHAHNVLLDLLLTAGIMGTLCYLISLVKIISNKFYKSDSKILLVGVIAYLMLSIMDFYVDIVPFYMLLMIIEKYNQFEKYCKKNETDENKQIIG